MEGKIADTEVDLESSTLELSESKNQITNNNNMYQNSAIENKILLGNEVKKRIEMESTLTEIKMQLIQSKNEKELLSVKHTKDGNEKITDLLKAQEEKYFVLLDSILEVIGRYQQETTLPSHILFSSFVDCSDKVMRFAFKRMLHNMYRTQLIEDTVPSVVVAFDALYSA